MGISARDISPDFKPDGSLRDIYVEGTNFKDWRAFLGGIQKRKENFGYAIVGTDDWKNEIPPIEELFRIYKEETPGKIRFQIGNATAMCLFFVEDEIELDVDPREFRSHEDLEALLDFLRWLGELLSRDVLLCHENAKDEGICRFVCKTKELNLCEPGEALNSNQLRRSS